MILLFKLIGCLRQIGFCEVIQSVIFFCVCQLEGGNFVINFDNLVFFEGFVILRVLFRFICSKITGITRTDILSCLTMLDCIFGRNLDRCVRPVILNLFAVL